MIISILAIIILVGIVSIFFLKSTPAKVEGQLSANDFEIIELKESN